MKRLVWAENARGIAIFLVVLGHTAGVPAELKGAVYGFHMHLFFFLSGLFFRQTTSLPTLVTKKARTLMWPYLVYSLLGFLIMALRIKVVHNTPGFAPIWDPFVDIFSLQSYWFLPVLFLTTLMFYPLRNVVTPKTFVLLVGVMAALHWATAGFAQAVFIGAFVHAFNAIIFFGFGYLYNQYFTPTNWRIGAASLALFLATFFMGYPEFGLVTVGEVNNYLYAYTLAFTGILFTIHLSDRIPHNKVLAFLGANSLLIYLLHDYPGAIYSRLFAAINLEQHVTSATAYSLLQTVANLTLLIPVILIVNRFFSWTLGRGSLRSSFGFLATRSR